MLSDSFFLHLLKAFLVVSVFPLVIAGIISCVSFYNVSFEYAVSYSNKKSELVALQINMLQDVNEKITNSLHNSSMMQLEMRSGLYGHTHTMEDLFKINEALSYIKNSSVSGIEGIYCIKKNGTVYQSNTTAVYKYFNTDVQWYQDVQEKQQGIWLSPYKHSLVTPALEGNYVAYLCPYLDYITGEMNGVVLIEMDCDEIWEILRKDSEKDSTQYSILNQENHVIYTTDSDQRKATEEMLDENKFSYVEELNNGWKIVSNISKTEIFLSVVKSLIILFTILLLVCFSIIIIVSIKKANEISMPIKKLTESTKLVQRGQYDVQMDIPNTSGEIVELYQNFNKMIVALQKYTSKIIEEQKKLRLANYKALQAQINPHFLYNTLDTIAWDIRLNDNKRALSILMAFTQFFRTSLRKGEDMVTLEQEFEHVTSYLQIQEHRYGEIMEYRTKYNPELKDNMLPKMILQPLVENSIYHGIKKKDELGYVIIYTKCYNEYYEIVVYDNGGGMSKTRLQQINESLIKRSPLKTESSGYGVYNIDERIKILFGFDYGLTFYSEENRYTKVVVRLPYSTQEEGIAKSDKVTGCR